MFERSCKSRGAKPLKNFLCKGEDGKVGQLAIHQWLRMQ